MTRKAGKSKIKWTRGTEVKTRREALGLNMSQMVNLVRMQPGMSGVTWGTYYRWEKGAVIPRGPYLLALFAALAKEEKRTNR